MKTCLTLFTLVFCLSFIGCGSDDGTDGGGPNCSAEWFATQTNLILSTGIAFGLDETKESCEKYVEALEDWLEAAEDCDGISQAEIDETRNEIDEIDCN